MDLQLIERIRAATVRLSGGAGGCAVLVPRGVLLTAADRLVLDQEMVAGMLRGEADRSIDAVTTGGDAFPLAVWSLELYSGMGALRVMDPDSFPAQADAFESWRRGTAPVPLCWRTGVDHLYNRVRVWAVPPDGDAVEGTASSGGWGSTIVELKSPLPTVSDGCAIVNEAGELVALGTTGLTARVAGAPPEGACPRPCRALPPWLLERLEGAAWAWEDEPERRATGAAIREWFAAPTGAVATLLARAAPERESLRGALLAMALESDPDARRVLDDLFEDADVPPWLRGEVLGQLGRLFGCNTSSRG